MLLNSYEIPVELQNNDFIISLNYQENEAGKALSKRQVEVLKDLLGKEETFIDVPLKVVKVYKEYFYRTDYHGDYLMDSIKVYDISSSLLEEKIQDAHAAQYGSEAYIEKYEFVKEDLIPSSIENVSYFMNFYHEDYIEIIKKVHRNKFRHLRTRNDAIRALNSLTQGDVHKVNESLVNKVLGKNYNKGRF